MTWDDTLHRLVVDALASNPQTFAELLGQLPNIYPTDLRPVLDNLRAQGYQVPPPTDVNGSQPTQSQLPTAHPLDYEWRFTVAAGAYLSQLVNQLSPNGTIVLLGAPSLFLSHSGTQHVHLIDANAALHSYLPTGDDRSFHCADLLAETPSSLQAQLVLADPPWYPEHLAAFLIVASELLADGGTLLLSLPGAGTRPTIHEELASLHKLATDAGLRHDHTLTRVLQYDTPTFEKNALRAAGITLHIPWRHGDLAQFTKAGPCRAARSTAPPEQWVEYALGTVRLRVRAHTLDEFYDPRLISLVPGDVLPTVSRRDQRRAHARVWTSGNRIYDTHGMGALHVILNALRDGNDPRDAVATAIGRALDLQEQQIVTEAAQQVRELIEVETAENQKSDA